MLLPLQGEKYFGRFYTQGDALGYKLLAFQAICRVMADNHLDFSGKTYRHEKSEATFRPPHLRGFTRVWVKVGEAYALTSNP